MKHMVSVIIPVYNVEKYLPECLDSVIAQSVEDIEIICVNDGSTDGSGEILNTYAEKDRRIRIITQENRGLSAARNAGAAVSSGRYLYFLDSDDMIAPDALKLMTERCQADQLDFLRFNMEPFYEIEAKCKPNIVTDTYPSVMTGREYLALSREKHEYFMNIGIHIFSGEFYRRECLSFHEGIIY